MKTGIKAKLIALDIDGTILDKPAGIDVPPAVTEAVKSARKLGVRVCLSSSRPCFFMDDATDRLQGVDALIGCSGASIEILGNPNASRGIEFYKDSLPAVLLKAVFDLAKERDLHASFCTDKKILVCKKGPLDPPSGSDSAFEVLEDFALMEALKTCSFTCAYTFTAPGMPDSVVLAEPGLKEAAIHRSSKDCFVITNRGTDKGAGVLRLAEYWGIPKEAILAVGNDENDVPMLTIAGAGVVVENGSPEAKEAADWIAPAVSEGGAAEAIRRFAL